MTGAVELTQLIESLRSAVAVAPYEPGWRDQLDQRLGGLSRAFAEHMGVTEGPDGLYHELVDQAPRLAAGVSGLVQDHQALLAAIENLRERVARPGADTCEPDMAQLHGWARRLADELFAHRQRGADLVYEAYETDLGGET